MDFLNYLIALEAKSEGPDEFEGLETTKDDLKIDQVPKTYVLLNNHWDTLEKNVPKNYKAFILFIAKYRNHYIDRLETPYPVDYPPWTPMCEKAIYDCAGVDKDKFVEDVLTIRGWEGYEDTYLKDKAPYILLNMLVRWFIMHDYTRELPIVERFVGYAHYWGTFTVFFKPASKGGYKPNLDVMKYTIEQMSYKSRLKSLGSVDKWLYEGVADTYKTYDQRLMRGSDFELHYIQEKIHSKFKSAFKTIYRAQEANMKAGNRIFTSKTQLGEDIIDNTYGVAEAISLANGYTTKFFADPVNESILKKALIPGGITEKDLRTVILMIADDKNNIEDVRRLYQSLLYTFLDNPKYKPRDVGTARFAMEMDKLYKPGNTNDPNKVFVKDVLDKWLSMGSRTFRTTNRTATITTFRKSIYTYFILKMMVDK